MTIALQRSLGTVWNCGGSGVLIGLVSTSRTCSRPGSGRALTRDLWRVTPSRPAFKGRAWGVLNYYRNENLILRAGSRIRQVEVIGFRVGHPSYEMNEYLHDIGTMATLYASYRRPDGMVTSDCVRSMIRATLTTSAKRAPLVPSVMQKPRVIWRVSKE